MQRIITEAAPAPIGPYNQAVRAGAFLFCSGQIALDYPAICQLESNAVTVEGRGLLNAY